MSGTPQSSNPPVSRVTTPGMVGVRNRRDHEIQRRDRAAGPAASSENVRTGRSDGRIERQPASVEIVCEHGSGRCFEGRTASVFRHDGPPARISA
jgi:hypothetical protein